MLCVTSQTPNGSHRVVRINKLNFVSMEDLSCMELSNKEFFFKKFRRIKTNKDRGLKFEMGIARGIGNMLL